MPNVWRWSGPFPRFIVDATLERARFARRNFSGEPDVKLTPACGWNHVLSYAVIGQDAPGMPARDGAFARAKEIVLRLGFSDPRIVVAHLPRSGELGEGDVAVLELKSFGPRFLCPVRVAAIVEERTPSEELFRLGLETLSGHIERGREWFTVAHTYSTGQVRLRIEARWRAGEFPGFWAWAGFEVMGRRYQRAWHHLAHEHVRRQLSSRSSEGQMHPSIHPVTFYARKSLGRWRAKVEFEREHPRRDRLLLVAGLGALTGLRAFTPLAWMIARHVTGGRSEAIHPLLSAPAAKVMVPAALFELAMDKVPSGPNRTAPLGLGCRIVCGAAIGHILATAGQRTRERRRISVLLGAAAAAAGGFASFHARRFLSRKIGPVAAALVEDAFTLANTGVLASRLA